MTNPVPRIEVVYRPDQRIAAPTFDDPDHTVPGQPNAQPWHVRHIAGNGETLSTSEQLGDVYACLTNIRATAALYGWPDPDVVAATSDARPIADLNDGTHVFDLVLGAGDDQPIPITLRMQS